MNQSGYTQEWLERYNAQHQHPVNRGLHAVGIPMIFISVLLGLASIGVAAPRRPALIRWAACRATAAYLR